MEDWITVECERALYVDFGVNVVACDRLPSGPVTLILKGMKIRYELPRVEKPVYFAHTNQGGAFVIKLLLGYHEVIARYDTLKDAQRDAAKLNLK